MDTHVPSSSTQTTTAQDAHEQTGSVPNQNPWLEFARDRPLTTLFAALVGGYVMGRVFGRR